MASRPVRVVTTDGVLWLDLDDDERSTASRHANALKPFVEDNSVEITVKFRGVSVGGHELEMDPNELQRLADRDGSTGRTSTSSER